MKKILSLTGLFITVAAVAITYRVVPAHGTTLIPVDLTPHTTLTSETSNNTSAANNFPGWPDGNGAAANISKVNIHTLLYPGNTTNVFVLLEPWFCVNSPGQISSSTSNECGSHLQVGYNENTTAQVGAMVNDMISRGIDGVQCDFYGTGYSPVTNAWRGVCDKIAASAVPGKFTFMEQVDDGSWKWRCDNTTTPTGWSLLGYPNLESCIKAILEDDLSYIATNYYSNPAYYTVNGRPVLTFFVDESNPQAAMGSAAWSDLWTTVRSWAQSHGNPYFVFENSINSSNIFWNFSDGAFGWPQPGNALTTLDWQMNGYIPWFYNTMGKDNLAVEQAPLYKGFNDTLASWTANRIVDQQCGQVWLNTFSQPAINNNFGIHHQLQGALIATWNDYEEGTEIETGIDNCVSISSSLASTTLQWNVTGNTNTLDHYTAYISTDGQNLAILADNISPAVTSLDLSQYTISTGTYALYVKAVGKPSFTNHTSNAVNYTVAAPVPVPAGPSCVQASLISGTVSVATTAPGGAYSITCNYGFRGPGITPVVNSGSCVFVGFTSSTASFNCTAGAATGTFQNYCSIGNWNTGNYCSANDPIASLTVMTPPPAPTPIPAPTPAPTSTPTSTPSPSFAFTSINVANITDASAQVIITTNISSTVHLHYGVTTNYGNTTLPSPPLTTIFINLTGLSQNTLYNFAALADPTGSTSTISSPNHSFTTLVTPTPVGTTGGSASGGGGTSGSGGGSGGSGGGGGFIPPAPSNAPSSLPSTTIISTTINEIIYFPRDIVYGDTGADVKLLQTILKSLSFFPSSASPTAFYGPTTQHSVLLFQNAHLLSKTGIFDGPTRALLNKVANSAAAQPIAATTTPETGKFSFTRYLRPGMSGSDVIALQQLLMKNGNYPESVVTGYYGALTQKAVASFQTQQGIVSYGTPWTTGFGALGPRTRTALNNL